MAEDDLRNPVRREYPFSAVVGCERQKNALRCALASPDITSVLISGAKGTGKTVLARSITSICGDRRVITLPLGSTEDMVFGGIDLEVALKGGKRVVTPGILSRADGNILLVENINLLPLGMLFQIMNAAETGMNIVERDGVSGTQDCGFLLIATMDAEEGSIPTHILDRFDICIFMPTWDDEDVRAEIVERRLAFDRDPERFSEDYREEDSRISEEISKARERVRFTRVPDGYIAAISEVCSRLNVTGHRGDISVMNASCTLATLDHRETANLDDLKEAAAICLEHRRNDPPADEDQTNPQDEQGEQEESESEPPDEDHDDENTDSTDDGSAEPGPSDPTDNREDLEMPPPPPKGDAGEEVFSIGDVFKVIDYLPERKTELGRNNSGRHTSAISSDSMGRCIGYAVPKGRPTDIALYASIRAAAPYQLARDHDGLAIVLRKEDLREKVRERRQGNDILFLVDGSGSIGAQKRMVAVKGAILSMLRDAYQKRDSIGMAVFRMDRAEEVLPLTRSILKAYKVLSDIPTGGRTPLTHGLIKGHDILREHIRRDSHPVMVIMSDGRCNVPYTPGRKPVDEMLSTARSLSGTGIRFIVIDTEVGRMRFGLAMELCRALDGTYLRLEDLNADYIESSVRMAMDF